MFHMMSTTDISNRARQELRRGVLLLAVLSQLREPKYGYSLIDDLGARGLEIDQGTLYPLLRRLESQGLLNSEWDVSGSRPRRYYVINDAGEATLGELSTEWGNLVEILESLLERKE